MDYENRPAVHPYRLWQSLKNRICSKKSSRFFDRGLKKCDAKMEDELDVVRLIKALRFFNVQISALMTNTQIDFMKKLAGELMQNGQESSSDYNSSQILEDKDGLKKNDTSINSE